MIIARLPNGTISQPSPGLYGSCPPCQGKVVAKCGPVIAWHWAHTSEGSCDSWGGIETDWHRRCKRRFPEAWVEVSMGPHRADVAVPHGPVLEFQNRALSVQDIQAREQFYWNLVWVMEAASMEDRFRFTSSTGDSRSGLPATFKLLRPRESWLHARMPIALDFGRPAQLYGMFVMRHWETTETWDESRVVSVFGPRAPIFGKRIRVASGRGLWWMANDFVYHMENWPDYVTERERMLRGNADSHVATKIRTVERRMICATMAFVYDDGAKRDTQHVDPTRCSNTTT